MHRETEPHWVYMSTDISLVLRKLKCFLLAYIISEVNKSNVLPNTTKYKLIL